MKIAVIFFFLFVSKRRHRIESLRSRQLWFVPAGKKKADGLENSYWRHHSVNWSWQWSGGNSRVSVGDGNHSNTRKFSALSNYLEQADKQWPHYRLSGGLLNLEQHCLSSFQSLKLLLEEKKKPVNTLKKSNQEFAPSSPFKRRPFKLVHLTWFRI